MKEIKKEDDRIVQYVIKKERFKQILYYSLQYIEITKNQIMNDQISFSSNRNSMQKFKVVLVGDQNVGKSSIIGRYIRNQFDPTKNPTIGIDFISKNIAVEGKMVRLQLWDTAGQERFKSLIPSYLKDAHLAIVVFDLTNPTSVESLNKWIDFVRQSGRSEIQIYVVGNKSDLQEQISNEGRKSAQEIAEKQAEKYKEVSAKSGLGIEDLFKDILQSLVGSASKKKQGNGPTQTKTANTETGSTNAQAQVQQKKTISLDKDKPQQAPKRGVCC